MIPGGTPRNVAKYVPIDHCAEGYGWVEPGTGESFVGIPGGWYGGECQPFIEVYQGEALLRTVNCSDLSEVVFVVDEQ
jgi:hypothetical protein